MLRRCNYVRYDCQLNNKNRQETMADVDAENLVSLLHSFCFLCLLRLLLISHHLELVDLLQFGNFECTVGLTGPSPGCESPCPSSSPGTPCQTSPRTLRSSGRTSASPGLPDPPCSWRTHQASRPPWP